MGAHRLNREFVRIFRGVHDNIWLMFIVPCQRNGHWESFGNYKSSLVLKQHENYSDEANPSGYVVPCIVFRSFAHRRCRKIYIAMARHLVLYKHWRQRCPRQHVLLHYFRSAWDIFFACDFFLQCSDNTWVNHALQNKIWHISFVQAVGTTNHGDRHSTVRDHVRAAHMLVPFTGADVENDLHTDLLSSLQAPGGLLGAQQRPSGRL